MAEKIYTVGGPDWRAYFDSREAAVKECGRLNRIPVGKPYAGTYGVELVTDPVELAEAQSYLERCRRKVREIRRSTKRSARP